MWKKLASFLLALILAVSTLSFGLASEDQESQAAETEEVVVEQEASKDEEAPAQEEKAAEETKPQVQEEPKAEKTEEPKVEKTEEPKVEKTEEPKVEKTEEPKVEKTEEPKAEKTDEPKVEKTEEPKSETTEEPKSETTEEPKAETTEEPKSETTEEPKSETTDEPKEEAQEASEDEALEESEDEALEEEKSEEEKAEEPKKLLSKPNEDELLNGTPPGNIATFKVSGSTMTSVTVEWSKATNANGYEIQRTTSETPTWEAANTTDITSSSTTSKTYTGLTTGREYYYHIRAYTGTSGSKVYSDVKTISYQTVPSAPTLSKKTSTASSVTLNWGTVSGVTGYMLYRDGTLIKSYTVNTVTEYKDTGLTAGTTYKYTIKSYVTVDGNRVEGEESDPLSVTLTVPSPTNLKATSASSTSIILTWNAVEGATSYLIRRSDGGGYADLATVSETTYTDSGLLFGKDYYYNVTAISNGIKSEPSNNVYGQALTEAPQNVKAVATTSTEITVSWDAVENASGYRLMIYTTKGGTLVDTKYTTSTSFKHTGLTPGVGRYYVVTAYVMISDSKHYGADGVGVYQVTRPAKPASLTITNPTYNQITLTWSASTGAAGYIISRKTSSSDPYTQVAKTDASTTTWTDKSVKFGQYYYYQVEPYVIESLTSTELKGAGITGAQRAVPPAPPSVSVSQVTTAGSENQLKITWTAADGGDGYIVKVRQTGTSSWTQVAKVGNAVLSATAKNLLLGESYDVAVYKYFNSNGTEYYGRWNQKNANDLIIPKPQNLKREPVSMTSVKLKWSAVGGALGYHVVITCAEDSNYSVEQNVTAAEYTLADLVAGYNYTAKVYTRANVQGEEKRSSDYATLTFQTSPVAPSAVSKLTGREIYSQIGALLQWGSVSEAQGYIIQRSTNIDSGYADIVRLDGASTVKYSDVMGSSDVGKVYYYRICSYSNPQGSDLRSNYSNVVAVTIRPTVPTNFAAAGESTTTVKLTWTPSEGADGYYIYRATSSNGTYKYVNKVTNPSQDYYINKNLKVGTTYYYKIRAYKEVGTASSVFLSNYTSVKSAGAVLNAPTWNGPSTAGTAVQLKWNSVSGSPTGYIVYRSIGNQPYSQIAKVTGTSYKNTDLKVGQKYNYKVAAYKSVGGKDYVGKQSSVWSATIALSTVTGLKSAPLTTSSLKLTWSSLANVSGYEVQMSTSSTGTFIKVGTTGSNSMTVTGLPNATYRYFKVRCYATVDGTTSYGPWSTVCQGYAGPAGATDLKAASITGKKVKLTWTQASGASGYQVQYREKGTSTWIVAAVTAKGTGVGTYEVTLPNSKTTYQIRLISMCRETNTGDQRGSVSSKTITVTTK